MTAERSLSPPDVEYDGECMECDGLGEVDCGRDWQRMSCTACNGTGFTPIQSRDDYLAQVADDAADIEFCERETA